MTTLWGISALTLVLTTLTITSCVQACGRPCNTDQDCDGLAGWVCQDSGSCGKICVPGPVEHPGSCPIIKPGSVGVCGGVFCTSDANCRRNQKCCESACGGDLCTNVFQVTRDPCRYFRCANGGTCTAPADRPVCQCAEGFTGRWCERRERPVTRDPCRNFRCRNGGTCSAPDDRPVCQCPEGFTGSRCQTRRRPITRDPCRFVRCRNGGTCTAPADRPVCQCPVGFTGDRCEIRTIIFNPCAGFECLNGGSCTAPADAPFCICPDGFTGTKCETRVGAPRENPGTCPGPNSVMCGGATCSSDSDCQSDQKCCTADCGDSVCTTAILENLEPCGGRCLPGQTCKLVQPVCAPGFACIQAFIPTCVDE